MHITMVIELFAIDSKGYSTSLLPFPMMWFLAKSAICQFKIYSMTFSSCAYCHSGRGLKAWNKKEKVITSSPCCWMLKSFSVFLRQACGEAKVNGESRSFGWIDSSEQVFSCVE